jgi:glycosyltransferase involved in cell wall biosynthesis
MQNRARILFLSQCLPYPPHFGVTNRTFNVVRQLQRDFDVWLLAFSRRSHQADQIARQEAEQALEALLHRVGGSVPIGGEWSSTKRFRDHARSLLAGRPYTYYEYESRDYEAGLREALEQHSPQAIHIDSLDLYRWIGDLPPVVTTCTHHSIESDLLRRTVPHFRPKALRRYVLHQADLLEQLERRYCPRFDRNLMMSSVDAAKLHEIAPGCHTDVVPNGVDTEYFSPVPVGPRTSQVVFVGGSYSLPNLDGVQHFLNNIWPRVQAHPRSPEFRIVGRCSSEHTAQFENTDGVRCVGYLEDLRPQLASAACCVVPLRIGGGTRLKILDAWAMGKAVVSTTVGCEGLEAQDGVNILVRDDPTEFADAVRQVIDDDALRGRLEAAARQTAVQVYSWERIGERLRNLYHSLTQESAVVTGGTA